MNGQQTKKAIVLSFIGAYLLLILPMIISQMNTTMFYEGVNHIITLNITISNMILSTSILCVLILLIYADEFMCLLDKTVIGKWINTPYGTRRR